MQDWNLTPFKVLGTDSPGLIGGIALAANGLGLTQSATYNVIRTFSVSHDLNLRQSDYWIESPSHTLSLSQAVTEGQDMPRNAAHSLGLSHGVMVAGGQAHRPVLEITANGVILAGQAIYIQASGYAAAADANMTVTEAEVAGLAVAPGGGIISGPLFYRTDGHLSLPDWTFATGSADLSPGAPYYLSLIGGRITMTAPTGDGEWAVKVGRAVSVRMLALELGEGVAL